MEKSTTKAILAAIVVMLLAYCAGSFIATTFNISIWSVDLREDVASGALIVGFAAFALSMCIQNIKP